MADNPYVGDAAQGSHKEGPWNTYVGDAHQGGSGGGEGGGGTGEGRTAPSEFGQPTTQDTARHGTDAIAHYQN